MMAVLFAGVCAGGCMLLRSGPLPIEEIVGTWRGQDREGRSILVGIHGYHEAMVIRSSGGSTQAASLRHSDHTFSTPANVVWFYSPDRDKGISSCHFRKDRDRVFCFIDDPSESSPILLTRDAKESSDHMIPMYR